jgi:hypothetical protein
LSTKFSSFKLPPSNLSTLGLALAMDTAQKTFFFYPTAQKPKCRNIQPIKEQKSEIKPFGHRRTSFRCFGRTSSPLLLLPLALPRVLQTPSAPLPPPPPPPPAFGHVLTPAQGHTGPATSMHARVGLSDSQARDPLRLRGSWGHNPKHEPWCWARTASQLRNKMQHACQSHTVLINP